MKRKLHQTLSDFNLVLFIRTGPVNPVFGKKKKERDLESLVVGRSAQIKRACGR